MSNGRILSPLQQRYGLGIDPNAQDKVYIGSDYAQYTGGTPTGGYGKPQDRYAPVEAAAAGWASLSPKARDKIYNDAVRYYRGQTDIASYLPGFYADTVRAAHQVQRSTGLKVTPLNYWDYYTQTGGQGLAGGPGGGRGAGGAGGPTTTVTVSEQVQLTNPDTARGLVEDALGRTLGRRPTDKEYSNFMRALSAREEAAPIVTESVTTTGGGGATRSTRSRSRTTGGTTPTQFAEEWAAGQEGAAETEVATEAYDALIEMLAG